MPHTTELEITPNSTELDLSENGLFCFDCEDPIHIGDSYWSLNIHNERNEGSMITVLEANEIAHYCEQCSKRRDLKRQHGIAVWGEKRLQTEVGNSAEAETAGATRTLASRAFKDKAMHVDLRESSGLMIAEFSGKERVLLEMFVSMHRKPSDRLGFQCPVLLGKAVNCLKRYIALSELVKKREITIRQPDRHKLSDHEVDPELCCHIYAASVDVGLTVFGHDIACRYLQLCRERQLDPTKLSQEKQLALHDLAYMHAHEAEEDALEGFDHCMQELFNPTPLCGEEDRVGERAMTIIDKVEREELRWMFDIRHRMSSPVRRTCYGLKEAEEVLASTSDLVFEHPRRLTVMVLPTKPRMSRE